MIYLIISNDYITIKENISSILHENKLIEEEIIKYDLDENNLTDVIMDLDTYNFLTPRKVLVVTNARFLEPNNKKDEVEGINDFLKYLDNPNPDNILILVCDKLDERKKIVKDIKSKSKVIDNNISIDKIIKNNLEDYKMDNTTINYLIEYCANDNEKIINELNKLKTYCYDNKIITKEIIDEITIKSFNDNIFSLIDAIMQKKRSKAIELYQDLLDNGEDLNKILTLLQEQFRMIYNGKILLKEYNNDYDRVAEVLNIHPYRFKKSLNSSYNYSLKEILNNLDKLDDIEINIKTGKCTIAAFELFIYSL